MFNFLDEKHKIVSMLSAQTTNTFIELVNKTKEQGATGFCLLFGPMKPEEKSIENFKKIIAAGDNRAYVTNYRRDNSEKHLTDDDLARQLLEIADEVPCLMDVMTDYYAPAPDEVTRDAAAVRRQKELISEIHARGSQVLMSAHIFEYRSPENILEIALRQQERGADIAKIVTTVNGEKEEIDSIRTILLLREQLNIPFVYFCNGANTKPVRRMGGILGSCFYLCQENSFTAGPQPTIAQAKAMIELMK